MNAMQYLKHKKAQRQLRKQRQIIAFNVGLFIVSVSVFAYQLTIIFGNV